ncbi:hypothetical protein BST14_15435 [Mycobacterium arosiense ATCC BAA-1401 = DSM 45069]|uniref:Dihydrodipicolinate reductase N-terminal domain-containing protein n=1 Tax=Mycobacterium arosiense ATCC BAA-1401 = DSM 45069 TaxID=1265311 RepID=A0A1W9ZEK9_MYCAI|nr:hypothetical protein BST14_15435 [Mycobacterium arosiense ATCC BAA-1401 = DSM 45069]
MDTGACGWRKGNGRRGFHRVRAAHAPKEGQDALIAAKPDCVIYAASGPGRDALAIPHVKLLEAGINVVTTSTTRLVNPHAY